MLFLILLSFSIIFLLRIRRLLRDTFLLPLRFPLLLILGAIIFLLLRALILHLLLFSLENVQVRLAQRQHHQDDQEDDDSPRAADPSEEDGADLEANSRDVNLVHAFFHKYGILIKAFHNGIFNRHNLLVHSPVPDELGDRRRLRADLPGDAAREAEEPLRVVGLAVLVEDDAVARQDEGGVPLVGVEGVDLGVQRAVDGGVAEAGGDARGGTVEVGEVGEDGDGAHRPGGVEEDDPVAVEDLVHVLVGNFELVAAEWMPLGGDLLAECHERLFFVGLVDFEAFKLLGDGASGEKYQGNK